MNEFQRDCMRVNEGEDSKVKRTMISLSILCCALSLQGFSLWPLHAQNAQPDNAQLSPITVPNVLVVEIVDSIKVASGVQVTFTVGNPQNSLYIPFSF